jgi:hypothetical protein
MTFDPKTQIYDENKPRLILKIAVFIAAIFAIIIISYIVYNSVTGKNISGPLHIAIGVCAIVPPVWFWYEYFFVYRKWGKEGTLELFKYGQQVSVAIWAGVLASLIMLAASNVTKPNNTTPTNHMTNTIKKEDAQKLIDNMPENASWEDLICGICVRQVIEKGLSDSKREKTEDIREIRGDDHPGD